MRLASMKSFAGHMLLISALGGAWGCAREKKGVPPAGTEGTGSGASTATGSETTSGTTADPWALPTGGNTTLPAGTLFGTDPTQNVALNTAVTPTSPTVPQGILPPANNLSGGLPGMLGGLGGGGGGGMNAGMLMSMMMPLLSGGGGGGALTSMLPMVMQMMGGI